MTLNNTAMVPLCHPSVRIAGTENDYIPTLCSDLRCSAASVSHLHCPFCVKLDIYHDARILKAHYRVKHVDKGIQFAGLKILRCCDQCEIVGAIKGEKKFKGAHWHCYRCKNGFNRRDEAVKHYKTHFRHPYTTFQIHISQEVNGSMEIQDRNDSETDNCEPFSASYVNQETVTGTSVVLQNGEQTLTNDNSQEEPRLDVSGDAMAEIAHPTEGQTAIMIIQGDHVEGAATDDRHDVDSSEQNALDKKDPREESIADLEGQIQKLKTEKCDLETSLNAEIEQLKAIITQQNKELDGLRKREQKLVTQLTTPTDDKIQQLIASLQDQHAQLLQEHLQQIRKEIFTTSENLNYISAPNDSTELCQNLPNQSVVENQQIVEIVLQDNSTSGILNQNFPGSYTICMSEQKNDAQLSTATNYLVATQEKTIGDLTKPNKSNAKVLLINQSQNICETAATSTENFILPASACIIPATQSNFSETNSSITYVTEDQIQNCIGATMFNPSSATSPYFVIDHKGDSQIIGNKRKLYIAQFPAGKKLVKNNT